LELPIDHFRLLGVGPTADAQGALQMLQQRLDRVPTDGYSLETLDARAELLRSSADLLSDSVRRARYEADLTALSSGGGSVIAALDVPSSLEVGGLVLLLEAGQPLDCFELANRSLQPPRAPALGSSREADLTLVASLACLAGAGELQDQRRYEAAAQLLLQGQQLLQRMGQLPHQRQQLNDALEALTPYRVLDLLSRPLTATSERGEGLQLLGALVERRGGLEGSADPRLGNEAFQAFFRQIRAFLTVQEQVDLFSGWAARSAAADFLASTALTASGFAQRKPERIADALARLEASPQAGTETLKACLLLLLGKVAQAQQCFVQGASPELLSWARQQGDDPLAQLCAYCRDWLQRDVLAGYRDLEVDPDLDAYFADRDVQAYIERHDPAPKPPAPEPISASAPAGFAGFAGFGSGSGLSTPLQTPPPEALDNDDEDADAWAETQGQDDGLDEQPSLWRLPPLHWPALTWPAINWSDFQWPDLHWPQALPRRQLALAAGAGGAVVVAALLIRQPWRSPEPIAVRPIAVQPSKPARPVKAPEAPTGVTLPLTTAAPTETELKALLEAWLAAKAAVLAGGSSKLPLAELARDNPVERLEAERNGDAARGESQTVQARINGFAVLERSPNRIAVRASLNYSDTRLGSGGTVIDRTPPTNLINRYVFARDGQTWRLVAFGRLS
jgi:ARC6-like, IMS domain